MTSPHVLAIDVGNSRIKAGLIASHAAAGALPACAASVAFPVSQPQPSDVLLDWLASQKCSTPARVLIGGVNPPIIAEVLAGDIGREQHIPIVHVLRPPASLLINSTLQPDRVGPDRLFDAVAANRVRAEGTSAIAVDAGTATTVDLIDASGAFLGGAILAGFEIISGALHERTALLPGIDVRELGPVDPVGRNTEGALRSGLYWGLVGGVRELVTKLSESALAQDGKPPIVLLTGGSGPLLAPHFPSAEWLPHLTLQGIALSDP